MASSARIGIYYSPLYDDPLFNAGSAWLGRDAYLNAPVPQPHRPGIAEVTADARGYGFHATLKPPMRLTESTTWSALMAAVDGLAGQIASFDLPPLALASVHGFLALRETVSSPPLQALADACVANLDRFRAPPSADELARRRRGGLSDQQETMLTRWGYPYVFETWFFHMTLTRRLSAEEYAIWRPPLEHFFRDSLAHPRRVTDLCVFTQATPKAPFVIAERIALRGQSLTGSE